MGDREPDDRLVIGNSMRTRSLRRTDLDGFEGGTPPSLSWGSCIFAVTRGGGLVALDVMTRPFLPARSKRREASDLPRLQQWLDSPQG